MSRLQIPLLLVMALAANNICIAADEEASEPATFLADLTGDGKPETILLRRLGSDQEIGVFFQLVVKGAAGPVLWKSPEILDPENSLAFGEWHFGISMPQLAGDIDRDGKVELLAPEPQSDVSPTFFRVLEWTGSAFEPRPSHALMGTGKRGAVFAWTDTASPSDYWVQRWIGTSPEGGWVVELASLSEDGEIRLAMGALSAKGEGFELVRWINPPAPPPGEVAPAEPSGARVTYRARLSAADHVNSSGERLTKIGEILRQDRANFHRGTRRDAEDTDDAEYSSPEARAAFASLPVSVSGGSEAEARIISGTPVVKVTVSADKVQVEVVQDG